MINLEKLKTKQSLLYSKILEFRINYLKKTAVPSNYLVVELSARYSWQLQVEHIERPYCKLSLTPELVFKKYKKLCDVYSIELTNHEKAEVMFWLFENKESDGQTLEP